MLTTPLSLNFSCGSGEVSQNLTSIISNGLYFCTDVNIRAAEKTKQLLWKNSTTSQRPEVILCDLFSAFRPGVLFDVIMFNPPYVPTDKEEFDRAIRTRDLSASWAGGRDGREVIDRFLVDFIPFLRNGGFAYLVVLLVNDPHHISTLTESRGFTTTIVLKRRAGMEHLYILRFRKN